MNYLMLILLLGLVSCGKPASHSNQTNSVQSAGTDMEIYQDDINKLISFDQNSIVTIAHEIQKIANNYADYSQYLKALDLVLSIRCQQVCTIMRKK